MECKRVDIYKSILELTVKYTITLLCKIAHVSRSGYYRWLAQKPKQVDSLKDLIAFEQAKVRQILGYRQMKIKLYQNYGLIISANKVLKIMRENQLLACIRRKKIKLNRQLAKENLVAANVLSRNFTSTRPGEKYATDITYIPIPNSMVYVSVILDLFNREVVAYKISQNLDATLATDLVRSLSEKRAVAGALLHSDQGIHYTNKSYQELLNEKGIIVSMSRKGNCWDNAIAENFFSHFKCECVRVRKKSFRSFLDVFEATEEYIAYYNHERTQKRLRDLSPITFRQQLP
ncbi:IS3 family transposase [Pelosinus sp. sgz500959]|uniref:IS3 family transposase n=1 Tax=Pelosinus sp. sgz500959 TaxID=3242472 RepID=UPI00366BDB77